MVKKFEILTSWIIQSLSPVLLRYNVKDSGQRNMTLDHWISASII